MVISICMSSDKNYSVPLGVLVYSIIKNSTPADELAFYVLDGGVDEYVKNLIEGYKSVKNFSIKYMTMGEEFRGYKARLSYITPASFYRLLIPKLFPNLDKILYLDVDILVQGSLAPLWNEDVTDYYLAAAADPGPRFAMREGNTYVNTGVMLMNLKMWRDENVEKPLLDMVAVKGSDQDTINTLLQDKIKILGNEWNYPLFKPHFKQTKTKMDIKNKVVLHYICPVKPHAYTRISKVHTDNVNLYWRYMKEALPTEKYAELRKQAWKNYIGRRIYKIKKALKLSN